MPMAAIRSQKSENAVKIFPTEPTFSTVPPGLGPTARDSDRGGSDRGESDRWACGRWRARSGGRAREGALGRARSGERALESALWRARSVSDRGANIMDILLA